MVAPDNIQIPREALAEICRRYHVRELALFGSAVRNDFRDDSDLDILVEFEPDARIGFIAFNALKRELVELLGREVDLVSKRGLNPLIRQSVLESSEVLYAA